MSQYSIERTCSDAQELYDICSKNKEAVHRKIDDPNSPPLSTTGTSEMIRVFQSVNEMRRQYRRDEVETFPTFFIRHSHNNYHQLTNSGYLSKCDRGLQENLRICIHELVHRTPPPDLPATSEDDDGVMTASIP